MPIHTQIWFTAAYMYMYVCTLMYVMWCADVLDWYEAWHLSSYRQKAVNEIYEHVCADDEASHAISIGPVYVKCFLFLLLITLFQ